MRSLRRWMTLLWCGCLILSGCTNAVEQEDATADSAAAENSQADANANAGGGDGEATEETTVSTAADTPAAGTGPDKPHEVVLGMAADLYQGISGDGPLTTEAIRAWLDDPENHETLEIELPKGMALGANEIKGVAENPLTRAKIELGRQLYFDTRLSSDSTVSCASCHDPDYGYAKDTRFGVGVDAQEGGRNSPVAYNRILSDRQFWDGRAASLEEQAVGPIANPIEMGNTHDACIECLKTIEGYRLQFEKIFPDGVTIDSVGKAIASFERTLVTGPSPYDYWEELRRYEASYADDLADLEAIKEEDPDEYEAIKSEHDRLVAASAAHPISDSAKRGAVLFFSERVGCTACHVGANFTDEKYHNLGIGMDAAEPDVGLAAISNDEADTGKFKTPTCRNVEQSAPYMHDGSVATLEEVVEWYAKGGHPNPHLSDKIKKIDLNDQEKQDLVAFMKALTGPLPDVTRDRLPE